MTTFYYQPQASEAGTLPAIFTSNGQGSPWPDISVVDVGGGTYALRFYATTYGPTRNAVLDGTGAPGAFADGEVYVKLKMADWSILSAQVRSGGSGSSSAMNTFYSAALDGRGSGQVRLKDTALNNGSYIRDNEIFTKASAVGVFLHLMVKSSGTSISVKAWKDGEGEPAYSTYTDSTLTSGYAALMTGDGTSDVYFIGVGTGADAAPRSAGGGTNAAAPGATLTGTSSLSAGSAMGGSVVNGTASGATLTGTSSLTAGAATGGSGATGSFTTDAMENNTGAGLLANTAVAWTWYQGSIGAAPTSTTHGTGTTNASGVLTVSGLPTGAGFLLVSTTDSSGVYYQPGTVT